MIHHAQSEFHRLEELDPNQPIGHPRDMDHAIFDFLTLCLEDSSLRAVGSWDLARDLNERIAAIGE